MRLGYYLIFLLCLSTQTALQSTPGSSSKVILNTPAENATGVSREPLLTWNSINGGIGYEIQVATDAEFSNIIINKASDTDYSLKFESGGYYTKNRGTDADWVEVPNNPQHASEHTTLTVEGWIKGYGHLAGNMVASDIYSPAGSGRGFGIQTIKDYYGILNGIHLQHYYPDRYADHSFFVNDVITGPDEWNHIAVSFDNGYRTFYLNGDPVATKKPENMEAKRIMAHGQALRMGARRSYTSGDTNPPEFNYALNGNLTEIRLWSTARTETEINDNKDKRLDGNEPGLLALYPFSEGSGAVAKDKAASNDGVIHDASWEELDFYLIQKELIDTTFYYVAEMLEYETRYYWRARNVTSEGVSMWSETSSFTTIGKPPESFPEPYALNEGSYYFDAWGPNEPAGTYPPNMIFQYMDKDDPDLKSEADGFANGAYNLETHTRINGLGKEGFSFVNINDSTQNPGYPEMRMGAALLVLDTRDLDEVTVSWTGGTVTQNSLYNNLRLQYRVGSTGAFSDVKDSQGNPVEYKGNEQAGHYHQFNPVTLPAKTADEPHVELRWKYYYTHKHLEEHGRRSMLRITDILVNGKVVSAGQKEELRDNYKLSQNFPNPSNPSTTIQFYLPVETSIELKVYNLNGQQVADLASGVTGSGSHTVNFNGSGLASGTYIYRLKAGDIVKTRTMVLLK